MVHPLEGRSPLTHLGVIRAQGEEAGRFLHNQLTQDFVLLPPGQARLAAFCNAKGRMLASFVALPWGADQVLLVTSRDLLAATLKRLSMFVLRSKVKLSDATADFALFGLAGEAAVQALQGPREPWTQRAAGAAQVVALYPADRQSRALWIAAAGEAPPAGADLPLDTWQWGEVRSGVATITAPVVEAFVPQMLNFESVGGVNFKKGCYPGQEVVARSQFRGTLKRRSYVAHSIEAMQSGTEVFHESDAEQPCGVVVEAAPAPDGGWDAIVSMQISAAQGGRLTLGSAQGASLSIEPAPYPLLADV